MAARSLPDRRPRASRESPKQRQEAALRPQEDGNSVPQDGSPRFGYIAIGAAANDTLRNRECE